MLEKYEVEFSNLFRRLMRLEITLRQNVLCSTEKLYGNYAYVKFKTFFINPYVYEQYDTKNNGNRILKIINDKQIPNNYKFLKLIHSIYLSHLLDFVLVHKQFYHDYELKKSFYAILPESNKDFKIFSKKRVLIKSLRNTIFHFNFEDYEENKESYLEALSLFELYLGCNVCNRV